MTKMKKYNIKLKDGSTTYVIAEELKGIGDFQYRFYIGDEIIMIINPEQVMYIRVTTDD